MRRTDNLRAYAEFVGAVRALGYARYLRSSRPTVTALAPNIDVMISRQEERLRRRGVPRKLRERVDVWVFGKRIETLPEVIADFESRLLRGRKRR